MVLSYTIQIYFDFSGYCDMAIGIGQMMNIDLPLNFNSPYKAITIRDFWKRWHMTLTRFLTKYIYIPLGGRGTMPKTCRNTMIVYLVSGLWHGANWTFILWGAMHGLFCVFTRIFEKQIKKLPAALNWCVTFAFVNFTWVFFRADNISSAITMVKRVLKPVWTGLDPNLTACFEVPELKFLFSFFPAMQVISPYLCMGILFALAFWLLLGSKNAYEKMLDFRPSTRSAITTAILLVLSIMAFSGMSTFLYFNF